MSFNHWANIVRLASFALAASVPAFAGEQHNLILLVPEALPAAAVDRGVAPTLARLRAEGVYFINSHSGFPKLTAAGPSARATDLNVESLIAAAAAAQCSTALIDSARVELTPSSSSIMDTEQSTKLDTVTRRR